jgi:squalene cyclase
MSLCVASFIILFFASLSYAGTPQISNGLSWLTSAQTTTGNWPEVDTTEYYSTAAALDAVYALEPLSPAYTTGFQWMSGQMVSPTDYLSHRIIALKRAGSDVSSELESLLLYRNSNGGWGGETSYLSDNLDTALALQALKSANYSDAAMLYQAINFLTINQNTDGGWGFVTNDPNNAYVTAIVLRTLSG